MARGVEHKAPEYEAWEVLDARGVDDRVPLVEVEELAKGLQSPYHSPRLLCKQLRPLRRHRQLVYRHSANYWLTKSQEMISCGRMPIFGHRNRYLTRVKLTRGECTYQAWNTIISATNNTLIVYFSNWLLSNEIFLGNFMDALLDIVGSYQVGILEAIETVRGYWV